MHPYEHVNEHSWSAPSPPSEAPRAALNVLRTARRRAVRVAALVVGGQLCTVAVAAEAPRVMSVALAGPLNVGFFVVLLQLGFAAWAVVWYGRYGRNELDPLARRYRASSGPHESGDRQGEGRR